MTGQARFVMVANAVRLTRADLVTLAKNSFMGSFPGDDAKAGHLAAVDAYAASAVWMQLSGYG